MQRFLLAWLVWLMLEAILLQAAAVLLLGGSSLPQSSETASALTSANSDSSDSLFKETFSVSQELSFLCKQESKQSCALDPSVDPLLRVQERDDRWPLARVVVSLPTVFFFPRKLSPPSAEDDPFLS